MKVLLTAALAAIVLTGSMDAFAAGASRPREVAKPSSFAPRHTGRRVYGAPIQPPIFGPQKRAHSHKASASQSTAKTAKKKATQPASKAKASKPTEAGKEASRD